MNKKYTEEQIKICLHLLQMHMKKILNTPKRNG